MESQARGGTRWKRFAVVMVPSVAATAAIGVALAQGALAASFSVSGQSFKVSAGELVGQDFVQYGSLADGTDLKGNKTLNPVAVSGFSSATITNMCQSVVTPDVPVFGSISLELRAAGATANRSGRPICIWTSPSSKPTPSSRTSTSVWRPATRGSSRGPRRRSIRSASPSVPKRRR